MTSPTYKGKGKNEVPPSAVPILTRLHISGLAPSVQAKDIVDRFASFGQVEGGVEGVDGLKVDANGDRKGYAFVNLHTTTHQLNKCISSLSGSLWKGHKLRIAPAKADYRKRLELERAIAADVAAGRIPDPYLKKKKKKRRNPDPNVGFEATHFESVTPENIDQHRGWTLDRTIPSAPIALFPLIVRPSHPIFPPPKPAPTSWTRETPKARQARELRIKAALERPVLRSKRMRIDPRKWGRRRVVFDRDQEEGQGFGVGVGVGKAVMRGYWECEEVEGRSRGEEVAWVYKAPDGTVRRREVIRLGAARFGERTDRFTTLLEGLNTPEGGTKVETVPKEGKEVREDDDSNPEPNDEDGLAGSPERPTKRLKSLSPPPYVPVAPRSLLYNEEDAFALLSTTREEAELKEARRLEKEAQLKVLVKLVEVEQELDSKHEDREKAEVQGIEGRKLPKVEGFANDDDDEWGEVLRLRGGAKTSSDEEEVSSDDDTSDDEDEDESSGEEEEDVAAPVASTSTKPAAEETSTLKRGMLKEMFKPKAAEASFSILDGLDLELEELERTPSPPLRSHFNAGTSISSAPYQHRNTFIAPPALGRSSRAWIGTAPTTPFFPFPSGAFEVRGTGEINEDEVKKMGMTMEKAEELKRESERNLAEGVNKFWAYESPEEFEKLHQELRDKLRGHARKRHREAVKKQSKLGEKGVTTIL